MVSDVCQKVIVPVLYSRGKKDYYKLKPADVKDVLKYSALTQLQDQIFIQIYVQVGEAAMALFNSNFISEAAATSRLLDVTLVLGACDSQGHGQIAKIGFCGARFGSA